MAEEQAVKSKRDQFGERLKKKYPDRDYADDEALFGQINDDYDEYDKKLGGYEERESKLTDLFTRDPRSAQFITDMAKGNNPISGLVNLIGLDGLKEMLEDETKIEEFNKQNDEYLKRVAKNQEIKEAWDKNMPQTLQMLEEKKTELGLTDEQIDQAADWIQSVINDGIVGIIKPETFDMAIKAINHDVDVETASAEGEIRGRNTKAEASLRKPKRGDGTPILGGANNAPAPSMKEDSIFSVADGAK